MQIALGQHAGALSRDSPEIGDARFVDLLERLRDGGDEQLSALVLLDDTLVCSRIRPARLPVPGVVGEAERVSNPVRLPDCLPELKRDGAQLVALVEVASNGADLLA